MILMTSSSMIIKGDIIFENNLFMKSLHILLIIFVVLDLLELNIDQIINFFEIFSKFKTNQMNILSFLA
jgi:hypothetical protein